MRGLKGKGVLVSGGSRGIGKAAVIRFLEEEARVFFCGLEAGEVADTLRELNRPQSVDGMACNIAHAGEIESLVSRAEAFLGRIDILINNAGIAWEEPFLEITPEHWDQIMQVNLRGMFLVGQAVARRMMADKKGGAIVNMSSTNGLVGVQVLSKRRCRNRSTTRTPSPLTAETRYPCSGRGNPKRLPQRMPFSPRTTPRSSTGKAWS